MKVIDFTKMEGLGNDYLYIYSPSGVPENISEMARVMSDRHFGAGSDGIILILPSVNADFEMRIYNADGSEAKMCGNGIRCVGKYVYDRGLTAKRNLNIDTLSGIKALELAIDNDGTVGSVTVDMGMAIVEPNRVPVVFDGDAMKDELVETSCGQVRITAVSMGNPHGVIFCDSIATKDISVIGPELESHRIWPDRANIEFAEVIDPKHIKMRVWERGSGETMACGTGACATAYAGYLTGRTERDVTISLLGGDLRIKIMDDGHIFMTGPAKTVYDGRYYYDKD